MEHSERRYLELAKKWKEGTITPEEATEYLNWFNEDDGEALAVPRDFAASSEELKGRMFTTVKQQMSPVVLLRKRILRVVSVAAIFILLIGSIWYLTRSNAVQKTYPAAKIQDPDFKNDILPGSTHATLTLADGSTIVLDTAADGTLAEQEGAKVMNKDGTLSYTLTTDHSPLTYNTLTTHRGEQYPLTLSDGTKVWLNASSSIRFPVAFTGSERKVEITGEAYFEVKHNAKQPFRVQLPNGSVVEDIGTSFNINAYADETDIKATLIEGSVRIVNSHQQIAVLHPGQQAVISPANPSIPKIMVPDIDAVMAWKNGRFEFKSSTIDDVIRQVVRWYNVDVHFEGAKTNDKFSGGIPRAATLTELLSILKASRVNFKLEGNQLTVLP
jgi:ferric-dicitrate binding protein FerR (iron transport regulator)